MEEQYVQQIGELEESLRHLRGFLIACFIPPRHHHSRPLFSRCVDEFNVCKSDLAGARTQVSDLEGEKAGALHDLSAVRKRLEEVQRQAAEQSEVGVSRT